MKAVLLLFTFLSTLPSIALAISPNKLSTASSHLIEVNKNWIKNSVIDKNTKLISFKNDMDRIHFHLSEVILLLESKNTDHLTKIQIEKRNCLINELKVYNNHKIYPINKDFEYRIPYFIDHKNTACAVGHLIIQSGGEDLANAIRSKDNNGYIRDLINSHPQINDWAFHNGFSLDELALIQPGYNVFPKKQKWNTVGSGQGFDGSVHVMKSYNDEFIYMAGSFTHMDNVEARSIISWNGSQWAELAGGVNGVIYDMEIDEHGIVYIAGEFEVYGDSSIMNLAKWDGSEWSRVVPNDIVGCIDDIFIWAQQLFITGNFEFYDSGNLIENLAIIDLYTSTIGNYNGDFSVDGEVAYFDVYEDSLLIAGSFSSTGNNSLNSTLTKLNSGNLVYWYFDRPKGHYDWKSVLDDPLCCPVYNVGTQDKNIYIYGTNSFYEYNGIAQDSGIVQISNRKISKGYAFVKNGEKNRIAGFYDFEGISFFFGNISKRLDDGILIYNYTAFGTYMFSTQSRFDGAEFSDKLTAVESFQDEVYFAGDFTAIGGTVFGSESMIEANRLISSPLDGINSTTDNQLQSKIKIVTSPNKVKFDFDNVNEGLYVTIYTLDGQLINEKKINNISSVEVDIHHDGIYIYSIRTISGKKSVGKVAVF